MWELWVRRSLPLYYLLPLTCRNCRRRVAAQAASWGPPGLFLYVLPLYSFVFLCTVCSPIPSALNLHLIFINTFLILSTLSLAWLRPLPLAPAHNNISCARAQRHYASPAHRPALFFYRNSSASFPLFLHHRPWLTPLGTPSVNFATLKWFNFK